MSEFRFELEKPQGGRKKKYSCPACGHKGRFTRYIDLETGYYVHETAGRCDREDSCGYHLHAITYLKNSGIVLISNRNSSQIKSPIESKEPGLISTKELSKSIHNIRANFFFDFLNTRLENYHNQINEVFLKYMVGTSYFNLYHGGTIFWQIDEQNKIRTGKVMIYNPETGKRRKYHGSTNWVHSILKIEKFNLKQVYFGTHLLSKYPQAYVGIVESEKTAIIASIVFPEYVWLATGGINNIKKEKNKVLKDRNVILFPDSNATDKWREKEKVFDMCSSICTIDLTDKYPETNDMPDGYDLADLLLRILK